MLLSFVAMRLPSEVEAQTVKIEPNELQFLENLVKKIKESQEVIPTPIPNPVETSFKVSLSSQDCITNKKNLKFLVTGGSGNYEIGYGLFPIVYYPNYNDANVPLYANWDLVIRDKTTKKYHSINVKTYGCNDTAIIKIDNETGSIDLPPIPDVKPDVVLPTPTKSNDDDFAEIGKIYTSKPRARVHFPSSNNDGEAQILIVKKDGKTIYSYDRYQWWRPENAYYGNHPLETQFAVENGVYDFYVKNTGTRPIIAGVTSGDGYAFYHFKNTLEKTDIWKKIQPNDSWNFQLNIYDKEPKKSLKGSWDKVSNSFYFTGPFYENGSVTTDKIEVDGLPNGLEIPEKGTNGYKFFKKSDKSKNITINFITNGISQDAQFQVLEKNGLDISPSYAMVTCWGTTIWKVFNNNSWGYADSDDFKPQ